MEEMLTYRQRFQRYMKREKKKAVIHSNIAVFLVIVLMTG